MSSETVLYSQLPQDDEGLPKYPNITIRGNDPVHVEKKKDFRLSLILLACVTVIAGAVLATLWLTLSFQTPLDGGSNHTGTTTPSPHHGVITTTSQKAIEQVIMKSNETQSTALPQVNSVPQPTTPKVGQVAGNSTVRPSLPSMITVPKTEWVTLVETRKPNHTDKPPVDISSPSNTSLSNGSLPDTGDSVKNSTNNISTANKTEPVKLITDVNASLKPSNTTDWMDMIGMDSPGSVVAIAFLSIIVGALLVLLAVYFLFRKTLRKTRRKVRIQKVAKELEGQDQVILLETDASEEE